MVVATTVFVGCEGVDMTEEEENLFLSYSVNAVVNHDKNYINKLEYVEIESESTTVWHSEDENTGKETTKADDSGQGSQGGEEQTTAFEVNTDVNTAINISGIDISYNGYIMTKSYPAKEDNSFIMKSTSGSNLVVMKFKVKNTSSKDINIDILNSDYRFKGIFNGQVKANCQTTLLDDALNTYAGMIKAGKSKDLVLIFQVSEQSMKNLSTAKLEVITENDSKTIILEK